MRALLLAWWYWKTYFQQVTTLIFSPPLSCRFVHLAWCDCELNGGVPRWLYKASFYPKPVLAFGYYRCLRLAVCGYVRQLRAYLREIHLFKVESANMSNKFGVDWPWPSRANLTLDTNFTPLCACPHDNSPVVKVRISKFGSEMHLSTIRIPIVFNLDLDLQFYFIFQSPFF